MKRRALHGVLPTMLAHDAPLHACAPGVCSQAQVLNDMVPKTCIVERVEMDEAQKEVVRTVHAAGTCTDWGPTDWGCFGWLLPDIKPPPPLQYQSVLKAWKVAKGLEVKTVRWGGGLPH